MPMDTPQLFIKKINQPSSKQGVHLQRVLEVDVLFLYPPERRIRVLSISKFNSEGYFHPTAHGALSAIEKEERSLRAFRPIVYICSPYAGDIDANVDAARRYSRFAVEQGYIPIAPHLLFPQFLNDADPKERQLGLFFGNALMSKCSEVWVFGSRISAGMEAEIERAKWKNYRLRYFTENLKEA